MNRTLFVTLLPAILCAQQAVAPDEIRVSSRAYVPPSPYSIRVDSKLVELSVAVHDWNGRAVRGLTRENFRIYDEGKEREIAMFSEETAAGNTPPPAERVPAAPALEAGPVVKPPEPPLARFVALFIDDVNAKDYAAAGDLGRTQAAARKFVTEALQPGTQIGLFTVSGTVTLDFTAEASKLADAIASVKPHQRISENGLVACPRVTPYRAYQIAHLRDPETTRMAVMEAIACATRQQVIFQAEDTWRRVREISIDTLTSIDRVVSYLASKPGARVLILASSGFFGETLEEQQQAIIDHAIHTGVVINAMDSKGLYSEAPPGTRPTDPPGYNWQKTHSGSCTRPGRLRTA